MTAGEDGGGAAGVGAGADVGGGVVALIRIVRGGDALELAAAESGIQLLSLKGQLQPQSVVIQPLSSPPQSVPSGLTAGLGTPSSLLSSWRVERLKRELP